MEGWIKNLRFYKCFVCAIKFNILFLCSTKLSDVCQGQPRTELEVKNLNICDSLPDLWNLMGVAFCRMRIDLRIYLFIYMTSIEDMQSLIYNTNKTYTVYIHTLKACIIPKQFMIIQLESLGFAVILIFALLE